MARGQKIDELYISLGLDIARLQLDFDTAGRTVSETISRLNSRSSQLKLKMDVDLAKLVGAGTGVVAGTLVEPGGGTLVGGIGGAIIGGIGAYEAATSSQKFKDWQAVDDALRAEKKAAKEAEKALQDESRAQKEGAKAARENATAVRAAAKANEDLKESLYTLSHTDLENAHVCLAGGTFLV